MGSYPFRLAYTLITLSHVLVEGRRPSQRDWGSLEASGRVTGPARSNIRTQSAHWRRIGSSGYLSVKKVLDHCKAHPCTRLSNDSVLGGSPRRPEFALLDDYLAHPAGFIQRLDS